MNFALIFRVKFGRVKNSFYNNFTAKSPRLFIFGDYGKPTRRDKMLSKNDQNYLLSQYKKYNIPVYYWSGCVSEAPQPTEVDIIGPVEVDSLAIGEDIWDCL